MRSADNTAGVIVKDLQERKLIRLEGMRACGRGLPAILLSLDPSGAYAIGVSIGRRLIDVLLVDFSGQSLGWRHHELDLVLPDEALALGDIVDLRQILPETGRSRMTGIGIAIPYDMESSSQGLDISSEV